MGTSEIKEKILDEINVPYNIDLTDVNENIYIANNIASLILGGIAYCIAIFMTLVTALDICYITIPIFRDRIQVLRWDGTNGKYLRAVSRDAVSAIEKAETIQTGKSALNIYLLSRIKKYIISALILALILGGMTYLKNIIIKIVESILSAF